LQRPAHRIADLHLLKHFADPQIVYAAFERERVLRSRGVDLAVGRRPAAEIGQGQRIEPDNPGEIGHPALDIARIRAVAGTERMRKAMKTSRATSRTGDESRIVGVT
jgi:hypothetical protein